MRGFLNQVRAFVANKQFETDFRHTYFALRTGTGLIGLLLPLVLVAWGLCHEVAWDKMTSLSAFYWLSLLPPVDSNALLRNWFVGSLIAVGACLILYRGYGNLENWLLNAAGLAAIVVALNPMPYPPLHEDPLNVHYTAAVIFFLMVGATIWFCADDTLPEDPGTRTRARWIAIYRTFAIAMVAAPLAAFVLVERAQRTIWIEAIGIWVFSSYWFFKTYELSKVSLVEPATGPAPVVRRVNGRLDVRRAQ